MLKINYLVLLKPTQNLLLCFSSVINKILTEFVLVLICDYKVFFLW
jgi:hypothetical protein